MKLQKKDSGFTLIEIIVVIVIVVIVFGASYYINWSPSAFTLDANTSQLVSSLRYVQNLSMTHNNRYRLRFDVTNSTYTMLDANNNATNISEIPATTTLDNDISFGAIDGITNTIIFDGQGIPYSDDDPGNAIAGDINIGLQEVGGQTRTITIAPETGGIT